MNAPQRLHVEGIGLWSPGLPGWDSAQAVLRGEALPADPPARRPAPLLLAPAERRRAPDSVVLALEVAASAMEMARWPLDALPSVFVSAHGDLAITDYMCTTLASEPSLISPTRFHHSVHNAPAGYWSIATGNMRPSVSLSAREFSFAAGLLEAACQCWAEQEPVLLVAVDVQACGALASVTRSEGLLAVALVLSANASARSLASFDICQVPTGAACGSHTEAAPRVRAPDGVGYLAGNASSLALPLFEALAWGSQRAVTLALSAELALQLQPTGSTAT